MTRTPLLSYLVYTDYSMCAEIAVSLSYVNTSNVPALDSRLVGSLYRIVYKVMALMAITTKIFMTE